MLWKRKTVKVEGETIPPIKPKTKNQKGVSFKGLSETNHLAVILKVLEYEKYKSTNNRYIYIVSVLKVGNRPVTPYLKYINKTYCMEAEIDLSKIDKKYLDYDWMNNEETKRIERIRSKRTLQAEDGG
jgi:hypothetical protein